MKTCDLPMRLLGRLRRVRARLSFRWVARNLRQGDVAIDCGANVGKFTTVLAKTGATVYAFEPHPDAASVLRANLSSYSNVHIIESAVANDSRPQSFYLHRRSSEDVVKWSTGASLLREKGNVDASAPITVSTIRLVDFIRDLPSRVALLKLDVEGAEVAILNDLLDADLTHLVERGFVETHERIPQLAADTAALRARLKREAPRRFNLDWE